MANEELIQRQCLPDVVDYYHNVAAPWRYVHWMDKQIAKCPMDLWTFQEIIYETLPDLIIETGTSTGGSAFFFAEMMGLARRREDGYVITVDEKTYDWPRHPRITYITGDSTEPAVMELMRVAAKNSKQIMVVLDSSHTYEHVVKELELYGPLVTPGCYLVVEDTVVDGSHPPGEPPWEKGPRAAAQEFVTKYPGFQADKSREKHLLTLNPDGWIRRVE